MPGQPAWIPRIPDILAELKKPGAPPFLDREAISALFLLKRRQSIELMKQLRRYTIGKAFVVSTAEVVRFLSRRRHKGRQEAERQQRVVDSLADLRRHASARPGLSIPVRGIAEEVFARKIAGLPSDIELVPGRLTISFEDGNGLLLKLFELAQAIQNDPAAFAALSPSQEDFHV
jgi:hypothetical protein